MLRIADNLWCVSPEPATIVPSVATPASDSFPPQSMPVWLRVEYPIPFHQVRVITLCGRIKLRLHPFSNGFKPAFRFSGGCRWADVQEHIIEMLN